MRGVFSFVLLFLLQATLGKILSPLDLSWREYSPKQKFMYMMDSEGHVNEMDLTKSSVPQSVDPFVEANVFYYLYTRDHAYPYEITKNDTALLQSSTFSPSRKTKVLIHGYLNSYQSDMEQDLLAAYLASQDVNIVAVDWSKCAQPYYNIAVGFVQPVGQEIAQLIDFLVTAGGADVSDVHIIGHSLGAHVAAFASNHVTSGRITRISGLDPALPSFGDELAARRLDPLDADIVDCIHTCGKYLGFYVPLCTHDFYPNGGVPIQPGCGFDWYGSCSHGRSYELFTASITHNFTAQACATFLQLEYNKCGGDWSGLMGELAPTTPAGIYHLKTTSSYPYNE